MNQPSKENSRCPDMIRVLTFDILGVKMGVDTEQIAEVMDLAEARKRGQELHHIHEMISFGRRQIAYTDPKALLIKDGSMPYTVIIDRPDDIADLPVWSIQPLPPLLALQGRACAFWGAVTENERIVLLVDFIKMGNRK